MGPDEKDTGPLTVYMDGRPVGIAGGEIPEISLTAEERVSGRSGVGCFEFTVEDDGTQNSTRRYHRVEKKQDIEITCFDGEGLISKQYARVVDEQLCGKKVHT